MTKREHHGRILVGMDPSPHAVRAAVWAAREAVDREMPLHLVHALDLPAGGAGGLIPSEYVNAGRATSKMLLDQVAEQLQRHDPDLRVTTETSEFGAAETLVTLGGDGDFAGLLLGSVSLRTAAHAYCPTTVVRGTVNNPPRDEIVLGVERNEDEAPIRFAFESCERLGAKLTVVRAWLSAPSYAGRYLTGDPATEAEQLDDVEKLIKDIRAAHPTVPVTLRAVRGNAVPSLIDAARGARMIVIGAHRRRAPLTVGAGYVVQGLLSHAETPVAVVPIT